MKLIPSTELKIYTLGVGIQRNSTRLVKGEVFEIDESGLESLVIHPRQDGVSICVDGSVVSSVCQPEWLCTERRTGTHIASGRSPIEAAKNAVSKIKAKGGLTHFEACVKRHLRERKR